MLRSEQTDGIYADLVIQQRLTKGWFWLFINIHVCVHVDTNCTTLRHQVYLALRLNSTIKVLYCTRKWIYCALKLDKRVQIGWVFVKIVFVHVFVCWSACAHQA